MADGATRIAVLGASGLIGHALVLELQRLDMHVVALSRRFTPAQLAAHCRPTRILELVELDDAQLSAAVSEFDIVVNCLGVLQDGPGISTDDVHQKFTTRLVRALSADSLLIHISVPQAGADTTAFSRSKRAAEAAIAGGGRPHLILRPGFVLADAAYGGSSLMRALASTPVRLPRELAGAPFAVTDVNDVAATVAFAARCPSDDRMAFAHVWDAFSDESPTVSAVIEALRNHSGGPPPRLAVPRWLLRFGAMAGDLAALLGWSPPVRSTALAEMSRGLSGDPTAWRQAIGIARRPLADILRSRPMTVQEQWFGRLYLLKPLVFGILSLFWVLSGLIALFPSFTAAVTILIRSGVPPVAATAIGVATGLADVVIGIGIALRKTSRMALMAGATLAAGYLLASLFVTPDLWLDPVGSMLKTVPVVILMLVAIAISDNR